MIGEAPPASAPARFHPPAAGIVRGSARIAALALSRSILSFRTWGLLVFGCLPALLVGLRGVLFDAPADEFEGGTIFFHFVFVMATLQFYLLFCAVLLGASAFSEEVEDQTLVYLFARPLPRAAVFLGKLASSVVVGSAVLSISALLMWAMRGGNFGSGPTDGIPASLAQALSCCGILAIGTAAYGAAFAAIGTVLKRPLLVGVLLAFGWEVIVSNIPGVIPSVTVMYYLRSLFVAVFGELSIPMPQGDLFEHAERFVSAGDAILVLRLVTASFAAAGAWVVSRREYVLNRAE